MPTPLFAMSVIAYPIVDTFRIFFVRMMKGKSPFAADRNHIHHRLIELGLGHRGVTAVLYLYAITIISLSLITRDILPNKGLMVLGTTALVLAVLPFAISTRTKE